jgi:hypothetical protein
MLGMTFRSLVALAAVGCVAVVPTAAAAQIRPIVTTPIIKTLGPDFPKTEIGVV